MSHLGYFSGRIPAALLRYLVSVKGTAKPTSDKPYCIGFATAKEKGMLVQLGPRLVLHLNDFEAMSPPCDVCLRTEDGGRAFGLDYASFLEALRELGVRDITDRKVYAWLREVYADRMTQGT